MITVLHEYKIIENVLCLHVFVAKRHTHSCAIIWINNWKTFRWYCNCPIWTTSEQSCSLISAFVVHCLDNIIPLVSISEVSSLYLASEAARAGLSLPWSQTPKTGFLVMRLIYNVICFQGRQWFECWRDTSVWVWHPPPFQPSLGQWSLWTVSDV